MPVIVIGGGGHAQVVIEALHRCKIEIIGRTDADAGRDADCLGVPMLGGDEVVLEHAPDSVRLVNGIGSVGDAGARQGVFERFRAGGYRFATDPFYSNGFIPTVGQLVERIADRAPTMANRTLALVKTLYNEALRRGFPTVESNPAHMARPPRRADRRGRF
ncbi:MAG: hypothetical protein IH806_08335, partial [Proteobacteria bacterium]|nr:hypothetical protein [Pseudomonadota bacterium]